MIIVSLTLRWYVSYYGLWCPWSYLFLFGLSLVTSKRGYTVSSFETVRAGVTQRNGLDTNALRAVVRHRSWAYLSVSWLSLDIMNHICPKSATPWQFLQLFFYSFFDFFHGAIGGKTINVVSHLSEKVVRLLLRRRNLLWRDIIRPHGLLSLSVILVQRNLFRQHSILLWCNLLRLHYLFIMRKQVGGEIKDGQRVNG